MVYIIKLPKSYAVWQQRNSLFAKEQYGFLEGRSCITNPLETLDEWTRISDTKGKLDCIYLDFKKAFDSVPHKRLLAKLQGYQIRGKALNWNHMAHEPSWDPTGAAKSGNQG